MDRRPRLPAAPGPRVNDADAPRPWPLERSELAWECRIFRVRRDLARSPRTGEVHDFLVTEPDDAVAVIALTTDDRLVLVEQFRHGTRANTLEFPGGVLHGDAPEAAARRELREETGYGAADFRLLASLDVNPSWQAQRIHVVIATGAVIAGAKQEDPAEDTRVRLIEVPTARRMTMDGRIRDAATVAGFHLFEGQRRARSASAAT
jgi:ADP-ribose pyrophosphatase